MIFYSGFSLKNEIDFFTSYLQNNDYTVAGFSFGAIQAAHYAQQATRRIDTLQLFSPAFFQTKKESFKRLQMGAFNTSKEVYLEQFIRGCFAPYPTAFVERDTNASSEQLHSLLYFQWTQQLLQSIIDKGIRIEVYLGLEDKITDVIGAREFFLEFAEVITIRKGNHFLREN